MLRSSRAVLAAAAFVLTATVFTDAAYAAQRLFLFEPPFQSLSDGRQRQDVRVKSGKVRLSPEFRRQMVSYETNQSAGTVVVDTRSKFLYLVLGNGKAIRYGIGTARTGFEWKGTHKVTAKREWPGWTPPPEMRKRQPHLPAHMPGGINNPLGARALYLGSTLYRIHGTNEPWTIGQNVSSGCIRMVNADVEDLYERVKIGARVIVL
jgi:lipoprotein-anchoring transpeptidase ErfK/SrfK